MKVWITKYALTDGIIEALAFKLTYRTYIIIPKYIGTKLGMFRLMNILDYSVSKSSAIKDAEEMRQKKIASLKQQIKKFEEMRFDV